MKVVLAYPKWTGGYGLLSRLVQAMPPLNLALLGAIAETAGHEVEIFDGQVTQIPTDELTRRIIAAKPDLVALTATSPFFHLSKDLAGCLKKFGLTAPIVIGGPHLTILKEEAFTKEFDFAFIGESEHSFKQFLDNGAKHPVNGMIYRHEGRPIYTGPADPLVDIDGTGCILDQFPTPARHLLDTRRYFVGTTRGRLLYTSIQSMRGCIGNCIFCACDALKTRRLLWRSPESVVNEMASVVDKFGVRHFQFVDDTLTTKPDHILGICRLLRSRKLDVTFEGSTRANLVDESLISEMSNSGLIRLSFGLETVNARLRQTMGKGVQLDSYITANKLCSRYGVDVTNSVMIGLPGETRNTVKETVEYLMAAKEVKHINFSIAIPYPGTELYRMATSGRDNIELLTRDLSKYRRYNTAVTNVGDLTPDDLVELQNYAYAKVYSSPHRWRSTLQRHGILGIVMTLWRFIKLKWHARRGV